MPMPPKFEPARGARGRPPTRLPIGGRVGDPPPWPLPGRASAAERGAWAALWKTPQAVAWERLEWTRTVARYCRLMVRAERINATGALLAQATALEDRLGLTPKSMRLLLWEVVSDEVAEKRGEKTPDVRGRLKAVG